MWRACYEALAKRVSTPDWAFMNYGYAPASVDVGMLPLRPSDEPDRLCIQLYSHAIDSCDLRDSDVLEVGSGRGGGASYISRYLQPRSMTGMDFSQEAVDLCNRHRLAPGLAFVCGDAQSMPFPASSFDAVVNIESSHCYESMDNFLAEVCRVLRPGGRFFFADLRNLDGVDTLREQFKACGLTVEKETDITTNVLTALRLDNARKLELIDALIPRVFRRPFRVFAGIAGTRNYAGLESATLRYLSAQLAKRVPHRPEWRRTQGPAPQNGRLARRGRGEAVELELGFTRRTAIRNGAAFVTSLLIQRRDCVRMVEDHLRRSRSVTVPE